MDTFLFRGTIWTFTLIHHVVYHMIGYGKDTGLIDLNISLSVQDLLTVCQPCFSYHRTYYSSCV